jgi:hypothetical protein
MSIIKLNTTTRLNSYLGIRSEDLRYVTRPSDYKSVKIQLGRAEDTSGDLVLDAKINQSVKLRLPMRLTTGRHYRVLVSPNPQLMEAAQVTYPTILPYDCITDLAVTAKFRANYNLAQLDYLVELVVLE